MEGLTVNGYTQSQYNKQHIYSITFTLHHKMRVLFVSTLNFCPLVFFK